MSDPIRLADPSDLTIQVVEYDNTVFRQNDQPPVVLREQSYAVDRETLRKYSDHFLAMLDPNGKFQEAKMNPVVLKDDDIAAMDIWFKVLHQRHDKKDYEVAVSTIRQLVSAADKYSFDIRSLYGWFKGWYSRWEIVNKEDLLDVSTLREMLYPTWRLNHAKGFKHVTKTLAYHGIGHITEARPDDDNLHLHLPPRIIQQLNAAKGRLRNVLHKHLFEVTKKLFVAKCSCKEKTLFGYEKALYEIHVWPLESEASRNSVHTLAERLEKFRYEVEPGSCKDCTLDYESITMSAHRYALGYFDGLCLDCMDNSKSKTKTDETDYWYQDDSDEWGWDSGCRISHGQPTWYFSFMGRKEARDRFLDLRRRH